ELNGDQLTYYYMNAVRTATDRHGRYQSYLTNIMRWRDGVEETSGLAVAVYDLHTNGVQIFAASNILSDGCDYAWQTHRERYFVEPARVQNACGLAVFVLRESDEAEIVDEWNLSYAACPFYGPGEDEGKVRIYYFGVDEARERLIAKEQWAKVVGYEDHGEYQTISLADDEGYADSYALYQNDLEEASAWWKSGVCGILVNADGSICGVHVEGVGMVSLLTLSDENFYGGVGSSERDIPDPGDVFGVSLLRTQELDGMTGRVYELPEGYGSTREIYAKYAAPLLDQGFPISAGWSDEWDSIVVSNTYAFEDEDIEAVLFVVGDENLVFLERTSPEAEINPWDGLESMGWDLETYRYRTY
ncbi:MAG: hypothetical protein Q4G52_11945, partial [Clostridia bacterium]|nr:hypothetical protein [Clostridia bacterium]